MTSLKQIAANRLNALKSTGPRSADGKQRSRQNARRHGLTAETVITALESADDYRALEASIVSDYQPRSATERELVSRLASVLWRLRRATSIETGLFQVEAEFMQKRNVEMGRSSVPSPEWTDELDYVQTVNGITGEPEDSTDPEPGSLKPLSTPQVRADCFLKVSRLGYGAFYLLSRYESALSRQAAQLLLILGAPPARRRQPSTAKPRKPRAAADADQRSVVRLISSAKRRRS